MSSTTVTAEHKLTTKAADILPSLSPTSPFGDTLGNFTADIEPSTTSYTSPAELNQPSSSTAGGPDFLDSPPSPSVLPPPYASNNPFVKSSKHSRPTPLGYVPPPTPLASRRKHSIVLSPLLTTSHSRPRRPSAVVVHKFHVTRPRQSSYTPSSRTSFASFSPRQPSFSGHPPRTPGSPYAVFPPTPSYLRRTSMTPSHTPTIITIFNEPLPAGQPVSPPRSGSISSEFNLSLGAFETLPQAYQPQPSPPTSPNPSPITHAFPPLSHRSSRRPSSATSSLDRKGSYPREFGAPVSPARRKSGAAAGGGGGGPTSPGSAPRKAKAFLGVPQSPGAPIVKVKMSAAQREQAKRDRERRKRAEMMRPLPYAKKVEIDAFFGEVARKPKKPSAASSSRTKSGASAEAKANWSGSLSTRNIGGGHSVSHTGEDGSLWMDVEEEAEFTWLLSEIGRGGQPLPHWPIHFSSHLHPQAVSPTSGTFPAAIPLSTFLEQEEPEDSKEAWTIPPPTKVSVLDMPKRDKLLNGGAPSSDSDSEDGSMMEVAELGELKTESSKPKKKRPTPLSLPSTLSSSLPKSFTLSPAPAVAARQPSAQEEGKSEFMSSTFRPASPPKAEAGEPPKSPAHTIAESVVAGGGRQTADSSGGGGGGGGGAFGSLGKGKAGRLVKGWFGGKK